MFLANFAIELVGFGAALVESLTSKAKAWESERGVEFMYDGVNACPKISSFLF